MAESEFTPITAIANIPEKGFACFRVGDTTVLICRFRDELFALENQCSHAHSTFDEGRMRGYRLMCPLHGGTFDIRDGSATGAPATQPILSFPVRVVDGMVEVDISGAFAPSVQSSA